MEFRVILLDTHVAVWLYAGEIERIPAATQQLINTSDVAICPIVELELAYLNEIGRINEVPASIIGDLSMRIGLRVAQIPFGTVCAGAVSLHWTRDPFDRLQAAHALAVGVRLVTKDALIRQHLPLATWI